MHVDRWEGLWERHLSRTCFSPLRTCHIFLKPLLLTPNTCSLCFEHHLDTNDARIDLQPACPDPPQHVRGVAVRWASHPRCCPPLQLSSRASWPGRRQHPWRLPPGQRPTHAWPACNADMRGHAGPRHHLQTEKSSPAAPCYLQLPPGSPLPTRIPRPPYHPLPSHTSACPCHPSNESPRQSDRVPTALGFLSFSKALAATASLKQADWLGPLPGCASHVGCVPRSCRLPFLSQLVSVTPQRGLYPLTSPCPDPPGHPPPPLSPSTVTSSHDQCRNELVCSCTHSCLFPSTPMKPEPGPWLFRWL